MKKILMFALCFFFAITATRLQAVMFEPGDGLYQIDTEYFRFIYSENSRDTAFHLASVGDGYYEDIDERLQRRSKNLLAVVISDDSESLSGYYANFPYDHIALYDISCEVDNIFNVHSEQSTETVFYHELTHNVSLTVRSPMWEFFYRIFGAYIAPQNFIMPGFMVEGVTVSFESYKDGNGRANNPVVINQIQQDIIDGDFKSIAQATGAYDLYPSGNVFYHYGGLFNQYLIDKYGYEPYTDLWQETGRWNIFAWLGGAFKKSYPNTLRDEWQYFMNSISLTEAVSVNTNRIFKHETGIASPVSAGTKIYYYDSFDYEVKTYDTETGVTEVVIRSALGTDSIDVSPDGTQLIVNKIVMPHDFYKLKTEIYDIESGKRTAKYDGIREADFFGGGIVAVKVDGHLTHVVLIDGDNETTLLEGTETRSYGSPCMLDENNIVLLVADNNDLHIAKYDISSGSLDIYQLENGGLIENITQLNVSDGKIVFSQLSSGLYKMGIIEGGQATLQSDNISGGVYNPLFMADGIYYEGRFSDGDMLMKLPYTTDTLPANQYAVLLTDIDAADTPEFLPVTEPLENNFDGTLVEKKYFPGRYLLPHLWSPIATISSAGDYSLINLIGIGFSTVIADPIGANQFDIQFIYNTEIDFADTRLTWNNTSLPVRFAISAYDALDQQFDTNSNGSFFNTYARLTGGSASLGYTLGLNPVNRYIDFYLAAAYQTTPGVYTNINSYDIGYTETQTVASARISYSALVSKTRFFDYSGAALSIYGDYNISTDDWKTEASFIWSPGFLKAFVNVFGAYASAPAFTTAGSLYNFGESHYPVFNEYKNRLNESQYYVSADAQALIYSLELQDGFNAFPVYFNRIYLTAGYRSAYLDSTYLHSAYARATANNTFMFRVPLSAYIETYYAFNNPSGEEFGFNIKTTISGNGVNALSLASEPTPMRRAREFADINF